jgi:hypothetical protein
MGSFCGEFAPETKAAAMGFPSPAPMSMKFDPYTFATVRTLCKLPGVKQPETPFTLP